ncbi:hypothetical protein [Piscinibacter gummiphilus]|uniref:DUF4259 domain-containing protein n=1 Tax=Piscinibacter gummiphilus TaxID=946333 RepID=A0ABZ0CPZ7_9BURK|nr:hypothetical protein [Piscinibacter gummiphilus]WOB06908.1 hypothetical protein RXV79_18520 [Piscinibacter gummiphilus]
MGAWSYEAWSNDEAADWFQCFWKGGDFSLIAKELDQFDPAEERFDSVRAAAYLLQSLGDPYIWPADHLDALRPNLLKAIDIREKMIDPSNDSWAFLEAYGSSPAVVAEVGGQITALRRRLELVVS